MPFNSESLSQRLKAVRPSPTIAITRLAAELSRDGNDIIALSQGEPDFDTPEHIKAAAKKAIDEGATKYTDVDGKPELKRAIVNAAVHRDMRAARLTIATAAACPAAFRQIPVQHQLAAMWL